MEETTRNISEGARNVTENVNNSFRRISDSVRSTVSSYGDPAMVATTSSEYLQTNTIVAKVAITLLVLIAFVVLLILGVNFIGYFTQNAVNPYAVKGMIPGSNGVIVPGNIISRSDNRKYGVEYTWSVWLQVNDKVPASEQYAHIFNKGNGNFNTAPTVVNGVSYALGTGVASVNNGPGLYLANGDVPGNVSLHLVMDTVDPTVGSMTIDVPGIPLNKKWMHVAIRLENTLLDVYVNGTISGRYSVTAVPKQNYGDIYVCQNGGFSGFLSNLQYYAHALSAYEINQVVSAGPNTTQSALANSTKGAPYYLSNDWYLAKLS